jgi:hypothetical protein
MRQLPVINAVKIPSLLTCFALCLISTNSAPAKAIESHSEGQPNSAQAAVVGRCSPLRTKYIASNSTDLQTFSMEYVNAPQASVAFKQHARGCVIAFFSAVVFGPGVRAVARQVVVRAVLVGTGTDVVGTPTDVLLSGDDDENFNGRFARAHSMIFVFPEVNGGSYRLAVQWKTPGGETIFMHQHSLIVRHQ